MLMRSAVILILALLGAIAAAAEPNVTLVAVGDIMLARGVAQATEQEGVDYPFSATAEITRAADLTVGNLECALSRDGTALVKRYSFKADPASADGLKNAGFDVVSLANNHSLDCERAGLLDTREALARRGLLCVGAGKDAAAAEAPLIVERNGLRIAFLAWTAVQCEGVIYREDAPGAAVFDPDRAAGAVRAARKRADVVIVLLHWGLEYTKEPLEVQRSIAQGLIDAGATVVIGAHAHTPQPVERYHRGVIAYSLGNFVFDALSDRARSGLILRCQLGPGGVARVETIPTTITRCRPEPTAPQ
jgi:poly-gamma-glutamate synthesis protein (capsule biosynthesis protein)